jgi:hypothetical protein
MEVLAACYEVLAVFEPLGLCLRGQEEALSFLPDKVCSEHVDINC